MALLSAPWDVILGEARTYPSPHNSQPIKVRVVDERRLEVFYDLDLGLPAENFGIPFAHVCAGVYLESLAVCAAGHGYVTTIVRVDREMDFDAVDRLHPLAQVTLAPAVVDEPAERRLAAFRTRQTSRRPYDTRTVAPEVIARVTQIAQAQGQQFATNTDPATVARVIRINQETLFDDLQNDAVHAEILEWIRTSKSEAAQTGDGLSAETMLMPGPVLGFAMRHREIWQWPIVGSIIRRVYLSTMRGVRQIAWFNGPFQGPLDYMTAGALFLRSWLELEAAGVSLHPFGTVVTNPRSHAELVEAVGETEDNGQMIWMLVRLGYSKRPPVAHRRPLDVMLVPAGGNDAFPPWSEHEEPSA